MDDRSHRTELLDLLQRLNDTELVVLNERWGGRTSSEIAGVLGVSQATARAHLGNIYDKLEVTYVRTGTSLGRIMSFYAVVDDPNAPRIPHPDSLYQNELMSPSQPSGQALELVQDDDEALIAQRPVRDVYGEEPPGRRSYWPFVALGIAGLLVLALLLFLVLDDDDGDDDEQARSESATAFTMNLDSTATALAGLATLDRQDLDATATGLAVVATQTQESEDIQATESADATASAQPTETPIPTETATETPEPTEPPEPTETPEPTEPEEPTATEEEGAEATPTDEGSEPPAPAPGNEIYAANWNDNPDEWELDDNWSIDGGTLTSTGDGQRAVLAPDSATENATESYAVEIVMRIVELDGCDGVGGPLGRGAAQDGSTSGYAGGVCRDGWRILAAAEASSDLDELQSGSLEDPQIDDQPHTYRIEIDGDTIRLFRDGQFVGEATDDRFQGTGRAGIFLDGAINVDISEFRVFAIETG